MLFLNHYATPVFLSSSFFAVIYSLHSINLQNNSIFCEKVLFSLLWGHFWNYCKMIKIAKKCQKVCFTPLLVTLCIYYYFPVSFQEDLFQGGHSIIWCIKSSKLWWPIRDTNTNINLFYKTVQDGYIYLSTMARISDKCSKYVPH